MGGVESPPPLPDSPVKLQGFYEEYRTVLGMRIRESHIAPLLSICIAMGQMDCQRANIQSTSHKEQLQHSKYQPLSHYRVSHVAFKGKHKKDSHMQSLVLCHLHRCYSAQNQ